MAVCHWLVLMKIFFHVICALEVYANNDGAIPQVSSMAVMPTDQLKDWLHRLVLGCVSDSSGDVERHVKQLTRLTSHIAKGSGRLECKV